MLSAALNKTITTTTTTTTTTTDDDAACSNSGGGGGAVVPLRISDGSSDRSLMVDQFLVPATVSRLV